MPSTAIYPSYVNKGLAFTPSTHAHTVVIQNALLLELLELVCTYHRKQAGIQDEAEVEVS